jgi:hypothetical protein
MYGKAINRCNTLADNPRGRYHLVHPVKWDTIKKHGCHYEADGELLKGDTSRWRDWAIGLHKSGDFLAQKKDYQFTKAASESTSWLIIQWGKSSLHNQFLVPVKHFNKLCTEHKTLIAKFDVYVTNKNTEHHDVISRGSAVYWTRQQYLPEINKKPLLNSYLTI